MKPSQTLLCLSDFLAVGLDLRISLRLSVPVHVHVRLRRSANVWVHFHLHLHTCACVRVRIHTHIHIRIRILVGMHVHPRARGCTSVDACGDVSVCLVRFDATLSGPLLSLFWSLNMSSRVRVANLLGGLYFGSVHASHTSRDRRDWVAAVLSLTLLSGCGSGQRGRTVGDNEGSDCINRLDS